MRDISRFPGAPCHHRHPAAQRPVVAMVGALLAVAVVGGAAPAGAAGPGPRASSSTATSTASDPTTGMANAAGTVAPGPAPPTPPGTPARSGPDTLPADVAAVAATAPAATLSPPAGGADDADGDGRPDGMVPAAEVAAELALAVVSSPGVAEAEQAVRAVEAELEAARAVQAAAGAEVDELARRGGELDVDRSSLDAELAGHRRREQAARARADELRIRAAQVRSLLQELAAAAYVGVGTDPLQLQSPNVTDGTRRTTYRRNVFELKRTEWLGHLEEGRQAGAEGDRAAAEAARVLARVAEVEAARSANRTAIAEAEQRRQEGAVREATLEVRLGTARAVLAEARRTATVVGLDMPLVVLDAIWSATARMGAERPGCHLRWNLLAAISRVESGHGRHSSSVVDRRGSVQPRIVGPPLDGRLFALIPDTDGGRLDGDTTFDRAVGPMQFIPSSWALFGRDGNGDGLGDPNNYYDAALAAAEHLCRTGADTATEAGLRAAVLSYNASEDYLRSVVSQALRYARFAPPVS